MINLQSLAFKNVESHGTYKRKEGEKGRSLEKEETKEKKKGEVGRGEEGEEEPNKIGITKTKVPLPRQQPHESSSRCSSFRECEGQMSTYPSTEGTHPRAAQNHSSLPGRDPASEKHTPEVKGWKGNLLPLQGP